MFKISLLLLPPQFVDSHDVAEGFLWVEDEHELADEVGATIFGANLPEVGSPIRVLGLIAFISLVHHLQIPNN